MALSSGTLWHPSQAPSSLFDADLVLAPAIPEDIDEMEEGEIRDFDIDVMEEGEIRYRKDDAAYEFEEGEICDDYHDGTDEMEEGEIRDGNDDDTNDMDEGEIGDNNDDDYDDDYDEGQSRSGIATMMEIWDGYNNARDYSYYGSDEYYAILLQEAHEPYLGSPIVLHTYLSSEQMLALRDEFGTHNKGLPLQKIAALPYKTHNMKDGKTDTCVICQFDYQDRESLIDLDCKHTYHRTCITQWLQINNVCPLCKREVSL